MLTFVIPQSDIRQLKMLLDGSAKKLRQQVKIAVNATAKVVKREMNSDIREHVVLSKAAVDKSLKETQKATAAKLTARITLAKSDRISLKEFGARQTRRGVTYRVSKKKGRGLVPSAFQGPKPGVLNPKWNGHAFKRQGKARLPIVKLFGPSAWGVHVVNKLTKPTKAFANVELKKQIKRRIRFLQLKQSGGLRGNQA